MMDKYLTEKIKFLTELLKIAILVDFGINTALYTFYKNTDYFLLDNFKSIFVIIVFVNLLCVIACATIIIIVISSIRKLKNV